MINSKRKHLLLGFVCALVSFVLLFIGIKYAAKNPISSSNILAYAIFSVMVGSAAGLFSFFKLKISLYTFLACMVIGFFEMIRAFVSGMTGWGDLIGVMSLIMWSIIGIVAGIFFQLSYHLYNKYKK